MRNLKRALSLALASVMLLGMMVVGTSAASYPDVVATDNVEAIEVVKAVGVMVGDDNGNFNPDQKVTRNEMAVVMANLLGLKVADYEGTKLAFTDVPAWAKNYVAACYTNGIISGYSATTFGGNDTVTTAQASLMIMKALGYFQNAGDFGEDWQLATVKQASKISLTDGISVGATAALTRNDVAQLVLNGLEADVVEFAGAYGTDIKTADGTTIQIGYVSKYDSSTAVRGKDYTTVAGTDDNTLQLAEKLFGNKLIKNSNAADDFGAAANIWTYDGKQVGKYAKDADATYTTSVKEKELYSDLGLSTNAADWTVKVDGVTTVNAIQTIRSGNATAIPGTGDGSVTKIYKDIKTIVIVNTYGSKVVSVKDKNANDKREITLASGNTYETEAFAKDDIVFFTKANGTVKTVTLAGEPVTGKITKIIGTNKYYIDGAELKTVATGLYNPDTVAVKDEVKAYVDAYGFIAAIVEVESEVNLDNLALFVNGGADRTQGWAELLFADGSKKIVDTDKDYKTGNVFDHDNDGTADGNATAGQTIVKFKVEDGVYKLSYANSAYAGGQTITKGNPVVNVATDDETVFVYKITGSDTTYKVFTGYKNILGGTGAAVSSYTKTGSTAADLVYVTIPNATLATTSADQTIIAYKASTGLTVEDGMSYYEYNAVVDGKVTTVKVASSQWATLNGNGAYTVVDGLTYDSDNIGTLGTPWVPTATLTGTNDKIKVSGGVINFNGTTKSYDKDTLVVVVDDGAISVIDVTAIAEDDELMDPYGTIAYKCDATDTYMVDLIVLVKN